MNPIRSTFLAAALAAATLTPALAQDAVGSCILAGRLGETGWAPRMEGVELLGANGQAVTSASRQALAGVKQVRLSAPALLSRCDGSNELALGEDPPASKAPVPAIGPGVLDVQAVNYPRLRRGGALVELRVAVTPERVTMVTR